jgi:hypothetical protein
MFFTELEYRMNGGIVRLSEISIRGHLTCPKGIGPRRSLAVFQARRTAGQFRIVRPAKHMRQFGQFRHTGVARVRRRRFLCRVSIRLKETPESVLRESSVLLHPRVCPPPCSAPPHTLYGWSGATFLPHLLHLLRSTYTSGATRRTNGISAYPIPRLALPAFNLGARVG